MIIIFSPFVAPTVGIRDVGRSEGSRVEDDHYLFPFWRKVDWVSSWDSMINKCHQSRDSPTDKSEYEDSTHELNANEDLIGIEEDSDNNKVDKEDADEEEEDCSDADYSSEADADNAEEEEVDEE